MERSLIDLLKTLVSIPSRSGEEKAACDALEAFLSERGLAPQRVGDNVWVETASREEALDMGLHTLLLNAHLDTVAVCEGWTKDPYGALEEDGCIWGLGSNDDGGSLVALFSVYEKYMSRAFDMGLRIVFCASAGEENSAPYGLEMALKQIGPVDFGIIGEPTGGKAAIAEKGLMVLDCTASGVAGHAAREEGVNAIYEALPDIEWFRTFRFPRRSEVLGDVRMSVTVIKAGTLHNMVPASCEFTVDVRPNGEYTLEEIVSEIRENVRCTVKPRSLRHNSTVLPSDHPALKAAEAVCGECFASPTTSNQTLCDFPTIKIGPGESSRSHRADEHIFVAEIDACVDIYCNFIDYLYGNTLE